MAHEIMEHDQVVLHRESAWHGLGIVVKDAPTPNKALKIAGLDWTVLQAPLWATCPDGGSIAVDDHVLNYRSDTEDQLGIVGNGYRPIQNQELADFCEALAEAGDEVKIESAGSIRNGRKVWFLLKGESFSVRGADEVQPFILVSNGHDGGTALRCTPTTIRVVCSNTLHMVIPQHEAEGRISTKAPIQARFIAHHTQTIMERVEEAKAALQLYGKALESTRELIDQLAAKEVKREDVQRFFLECYTRDFGAFPTNPQNKIEQNARERAMDACNLVFTRFDREQPLAGATAWNCLSSYTGWLQNDFHLRGKDEVRVAERKVESKLFGANADRAHLALATALAL
jgi:phage/plasmid-like protein (TIGR03299 family)